MKLSAALLFLTSVVNVNSSEYLALRGQKRRAAVVGFEDEDAGDIHIELPTPEMGVEEAEVNDEVEVPDVYSRSEEFGTLEETGEGTDEDDGTTDGGNGPNEPGYLPGMEPPDEYEDEPEDPSPCEALGADPDPEGQAYADCMKAEDDHGIDEDEVEESASIQYAPVETTKSFTTLEEGEGEDTIMKPLLPNEAKVVTKTITLEYADGTKATIMETYPELPVPTESPVGNPDPSV